MPWKTEVDTGSWSLRFHCIFAVRMEVLCDNELSKTEHTVSHTDIGVCR